MNFKLSKVQYNEARFLCWDLAVFVLLPAAAGEEAFFPLAPPAIDPSIQEFVSGSSTRAIWMKSARFRGTLDACKGALMWTGRVFQNAPGFAGVTTVKRRVRDSCLMGVDQDGNAIKRTKENAEKDLDTDPAVKTQEPAPKGNAQ